MQKLLIRGGVLALLFTGYQCAREDPHAAGRQLAQTYCSTCHLVPEPTDLTRELWITEVLPLMGAFYGIYGNKPRQEYLKNEAESGYLQHVYPLEPLLDSSEWAAIRNYYVAEAPDVLAKPAEKPTLLEMDQFEVKAVPREANDRFPLFTTMITLDTVNGHILAGGRVGRQGILRRFSRDHQCLDYRPLSSPPTQFLPQEQLILQMGSLTPSDVPQGQLSQLEDSLTSRTVLDTLLRPLDVVDVDLDLDGQKERIIAEYGNMTGRLRAFHQHKTVSTLSTTPGALRLRIADLDQDGHDDLLVLFAQGDERIEVYYARPGQASRQRLLRFPPSYGSSDLEIVDFDQDGDLDIIYTNGDNYDYQPILKPYHGIRLFINDGAAQFTESWFYPFDGAYGVEVADFDGDGDQDIAAIAYFVPPAQRALYSFVYLEQQAPLQFQPFGLVKARDQYFICLSKGDIDQDGDQDLLIGNFAGYLPDGAAAGRNVPANAPVYLWLKNVAQDQ